MSKKYIKKAESRKQKAKNKSVAQVTTAVPLSASQKKMVTRWVKRNVGKDVELKAGVDLKVIAGIRLRAGDWLFDGTFQGELERFRNTLVTS